MLANVPPRDAGAGSGALQAFQQVGGALGVAMIGEIFFTNLGNTFASGGTPHAAFAGASSLALWYVVGSFALVLLLAPFFKRAAGPAAARRRPRPSRCWSKSDQTTTKSERPPGGRPFYLDVTKTVELPGKAGADHHIARFAACHRRRRRWSSC